MIDLEEALCPIPFTKAKNCAKICFYFPVVILFFLLSCQRRFVKTIARSLGQALLFPAPFGHYLRLKPKLGATIAVPLTVVILEGSAANTESFMPERCGVVGGFVGRIFFAQFRGSFFSTKRTIF
ncbi:MAG: hypothetical protein Q8N81_03920 [bacterium]|nr:hypothetical protein [bacterium]